MSHFTVLVVTSDKANDENVGHQLAPFHEFECTGLDNEFIQDIDRTEELRSEYEEKPRQKSLLTFSQDYYGYSIVPENDVPDFVGLNKYGYITVNKDNEVIKVVQRTNPEIYMWRDEHGKEIAKTYGEKNLPFVLKKPDSGKEFLLDDQRRLVYVLQALYKNQTQLSENNCAAQEMASESNLQSFREGISGAITETELTVRDLLIALGDEDGRICGGSLPLNRASERPTLHELQLFARACEGKNIHLKPSDCISGTTLTKEWIGGKKWDWWAVGGRWSGMLQPKLGHNYPCERGRPGVMGSLYDERGFDSVRKDEVDWDGMIKQTSDNRNKLINEALDELSGKTHRTHEEIKAIFKAASENWKQVEAEWEAQRTSNPNTIRLYDYIKKLPAEHPVSIAIKTNIWGHFINMVGVPETAGDPLVWANTPSPFSCFGFLRDRKWSQRGEMHCFACVANEMDEADWDKQFTALIAEVPDDHWLTVVDCHI